MKKETAFKLGKGDFPSFYDYPVWRPNVEDFPFIEYFNWSPSHESFNENSEKQWIFYGELKEDLFDDDTKLSYIQGATRCYAFKRRSDGFSFMFANSFKTRERLKKWISEILSKQFDDKVKWEINEYTRIDTIPAIAGLFLTCDHEVADFLTNDH